MNAGQISALGTEFGVSEGFLRVSAVLTGFEVDELAGTGMAGVYRHAVGEQVGAGTLDRLAEALAEAGGDPGGLTDPGLLELARAVCSLWYLGVWPGLPEAACRQLGLPERLPPVRPEGGYAQGLLWRALGTPPPGTGAPGFGSWAEPPPGVSRPGERRPGERRPAPATGARR